MNKILERTALKDKLEKLRKKGIKELLVKDREKKKNVFMQMIINCLKSVSSTILSKTRSLVLTLKRILKIADAY